MVKLISNQKITEGDEFVKTVLDAVPPVALERGVFPEEALRERFVKVDQLARRLALVKDDKAKMPMYVLSYLQSMFILTPANAISKEELKDEIVDFEKLDTYDIMNRARWELLFLLTKATEFNFNKYCLLLLQVLDGTWQPDTDR